MNPLPLKGRKVIPIAEAMGRCENINFALLMQSLPDGYMCIVSTTSFHISDVIKYEMEVISYAELQLEIAIGEKVNQSFK